MDLTEQIERATRINSPDANIVFQPIKGASKKKKNLPKPKLRIKNTDLFESDVSDSPAEVMPEPFDPEEIQRNIESVNGGVDFSDTAFVQNLLRKQKENGANPQSPEDSTCAPDIAGEHSGDGDDGGKAVASTSKEATQEEKEELSSEKIKQTLRKCKLNKNAAIESLDSKEEPPKGEKYKMKLVSHPEVPEVFVQPLQAYGNIDEEEYKEIDFTVPRIGKKKTVTPQEYFLYQTDNSFFDFAPDNKNH